MSNTFWRFLLCFLVALLVFGVVGVVISFAVRHGGAEFVVEYNGDTYYSNSEEQEIYLGAGDHQFAVKFVSGKHANYSAKVVAMADNNFAFTVDGKVYQFYGTDEDSNNYSEVFGLRSTKDGFVVSIPDSFSIKQAVEEKYGGAVELEQALQGDVCYFAISVVSGDNVIYLPFTFGLFLSLDTEHVIF